MTLGQVPGLGATTEPRAHLANPPIAGPAMLDVLHISAVSLVAFAATNVDNLWLLVALLARGGAPRPIGFGYFAATVLVSCVAWAASAGLEQIPPRWIDWLGIIPIALGLARVREALGPESDDLPPPRAQGAFALTLSQSADNLAVLASLYADARRSLEPAIFTTVACAALLLCALAVRIAHYPRLQAPLHRVARRALPFVLVAVGLHLLADTSTDEPDAPSGVGVTREDQLGKLAVIAREVMPAGQRDGARVSRPELRTQAAVVAAVDAQRSPSIELQRLRERR
jgi:cadmium resistance protein CadD (predicted permease)